MDSLMAYLTGGIKPKEGFSKKISKMQADAESSKSVMSPNYRAESEDKNLDLASQVLGVIDLLTLPGLVKSSATKVAKEAIKQSAESTVPKILTASGKLETPYAYTLPKDDSSRRAYELLSGSSSGTVSDREFFEQMAELLVKEGKMPAAEAKKLKALNTKFEGKQAWEFIADKNRSTKMDLADSDTLFPYWNATEKTTANAVIKSPKGFYKPETIADARLLNKEDKAGRNRMTAELRKQEELINNIKNNIAELVEPVASKHAAQVYGKEMGTQERMQAAGFIPKKYERADSAFSGHANPDFLDPTSVANITKSVMQEDLKGSAARYHGQFFTEANRGGTVAELAKYSGPSGFPTVQTPVYLKNDVLENAYDATNPAHFSKVVNEFKAAGILDDNDVAVYTQILRDEVLDATQRFPMLESQANMALMKNAGFKGFWTDEPGYLRGNIAVFDPTAVRDIRAVFDPTLSGSTNRFAGVAALPISTPLIDYINGKDSSNGK